jgi:hypothetical protein
MKFVEFCEEVTTYVQHLSTLNLSDISSKNCAFSIFVTTTNILHRLSMYVYVNGLSAYQMSPS